MPMKTPEMCFVCAEEEARLDEEAMARTAAQASDQPSPQPRQMQRRVLAQEDFGT